MDNYISFSDDKIPPNDRRSTKALHITTKVKDCTLPKVLIDNKSSLNVMPLSTLMRLPVDRSYIKHTHTMVRAFDGTRWEVIGEIEIEMCHNGFPLDLDDHKNKNGVAIDLFYTGVIGHLGYMFSN